jgi:hypothetical protein
MRESAADSQFPDPTLFYFDGRSGDEPSSRGQCMTALIRPRNPHLR